MGVVDTLKALKLILKCNKSQPDFLVSLQRYSRCSQHSNYFSNRIRWRISFKPKKSKWPGSCEKVFHDQALRKVGPACIRHLRWIFHRQANASLVQTRRDFSPTDIYLISNLEKITRRTYFAQCNHSEHYGGDYLRI